MPICEVEATVKAGVAAPPGLKVKLELALLKEKFRSPGESFVIEPSAYTVELVPTMMPTPE